MQQDANYLAYVRMLKNRKWVATHRDQYTGWLSGKQVFSEKFHSRQDALIFAAKQFPEQPIFIARVGEQPRLQRLRSPRRVR